MKYPEGQEKVLGCEVPVTAKARVSRILVGRVYNLGNYENKRVEIEVSIPPGESATDVLIGLERLLDAFNSKCPVDEYSILEAKRRQSWSDEDWKRYEGDQWEARKQENQNRLVELDTKLANWQAKQAIVRKLLDDLGAAVNYKDHKLDWEDNQGEDY